MKLSIEGVAVALLALAMIVGVAGGCTVKLNKASQDRINTAMSATEAAANKAAQAAAKAEAAAKSAANSAEEAQSSAQKAMAILDKTMRK